MPPQTKFSQSARESKAKCQLQTKAISRPALLRPACPLRLGSRAESFSYFVGQQVSDLRPHNTDALLQDIGKTNRLHWDERQCGKKGCERFEAQSAFIANPVPACGPPLRSYGKDEE